MWKFHFSFAAKVGKEPVLQDFFDVGQIFHRWKKTSLFKEICTLFRPLFLC